MRVTMPARRRRAVASDIVTVSIRALASSAP